MGRLFAVIQVLILFAWGINTAMETIRTIHNNYGFDKIEIIPCQSPKKLKRARLFLIPGFGRGGGRPGISSPPPP